MKVTLIDGTYFIFNFDYIDGKIGKCYLFDHYGKIYPSYAQLDETILIPNPKALETLLKLRGLYESL